MSLHFEQQNTVENQMQENRANFAKEFGNNNKLEGQDKKAANEIAEHFNGDLKSSVKDAIKTKYASQINLININPDKAKEFQNNLDNALEGINTLQDGIEALLKISNAFETANGAAGGINNRQLQDAELANQKSNKEKNEYAENIKKLINEARQAQNDSQKQRVAEQQERNANEEKEKTTEIANENFDEQLKEAFT